MNTIHIGFCKLCDNHKELKKSHAIPRSFFRHAKGRSGQLLMIRDDPEFKPMDSNIDPKEYLLCNDCEHFLNTEYEKYSIEFLNNSNNFKVRDDYTKILKMNYDKFYLFLISIIWRASLSKSDFYSGVNLTEDLEWTLKASIKSKKNRVTTGIKLDQLMPISMAKIKDSQSVWSSSALKRIIMPFNYDFTDNGATQMFYVLFGGYLFVFWLISHEDLHAFRTFNAPFRIERKAPFKISHVDIRELKEFTNTISIASNYFSNNK